jgi:protein tyrosine phosphatase (PTP) superfamily phosphohydrolase (DUF442 family)
MGMSDTLRRAMWAATFGGAIGAVIALGCYQQKTTSKASGSIAPSPLTATAATTQPFQPIGDPKLLPNAHRVTDNVISGAQPEGDAAFALLKQLGIKTIISVDGSKPDVATAKKYGLRYVHLPITYSGVTTEQGEAVAKAIDVLPGPVYIHCHHGKHRAAAATAVACVYNGSLAPERAESLLQTFGTGANYIGLWKAARDARPIDRTTIDALEVKFVEIQPLPPLADAMVKSDEYSDHLKAIQKAGWQTPANHPDLDPPHEALQLEENLHEIGRSEDVQKRSADFKQQLADAESKVQALRTLLEVNPVDKPLADAALAAVGKSCLSCHKSYRD